MTCCIGILGVGRPHCSVCSRISLKVEATLSKFDGGRPMNAKASLDSDAPVPQAAGKLGRAMSEALALVFQPPGGRS